MLGSRSLLGVVQVGIPGPGFLTGDGGSGGYAWSQVASGGGYIQGGYTRGQAVIPEGVCMPTLLDMGPGIHPPHY